MVAAQRQEEREARVVMVGGPARMKAESGGVPVDLRERERPREGEGGRETGGGEQIRRCNDVRGGAVQAIHGRELVAGHGGGSCGRWWVDEVLGE